MESLAFLQRSIGRPIVYITSGPARENAMEISGVGGRVHEV